MSTVSLLVRFLLFPEPQGTHLYSPGTREFIRLPLVTSGSIFWEFPHGPSQEKEAKGEKLQLQLHTDCECLLSSAFWLSLFDYK